jgi:hypothetical protein
VCVCTCVCALAPTGQKKNSDFFQNVSVLANNFCSRNTSYCETDLEIVMMIIIQLICNNNNNNNNNTLMFSQASASMAMSFTYDLTNGRNSFTFNRVSKREGVYRTDRCKRPT